MVNSIENNSYLKFSSFQRLKFWDYYTLSNKSKIHSNYPLVELSEVLTQRKDSIIIDDTKYYKRCRVKVRGQGIVLRDEVLGEKIKTKKQFPCKKNDFLVAEIDAKVGGYGIVPKELVNAIVSSHYFLFEIDKSQLNPEFLSILTKCNGFSKQVKATGSTNYAAIRPYQVLEYLIPLPSIKEQDRIVAQYNKKTISAEKQIDKAIQLEKDIENYLFEVLEIEKLDKKENKKGLYLASFSELDRWDYWINNLGAKSQKYPNKILKDVVLGKPVYGANVKGVKKHSKTRYIRITDINEEGYLNDEFVSPEKVDEKYLLKENDFLIARSGNTVGKTLLYKEFYGRAIYAGYLVKYNIDFSIIVPEYLFLFTKSHIYKEWIKSNQRVSGQPNINGQEFLHSPLVLPPIEIQKKISTHITLLKKKIRRLKINAEENKRNALIEFEQEIFKPL